MASQTPRQYRSKLHRPFYVLAALLIAVVAYWCIELTPVRWFLLSKHYKAQVMAQPNTQNGNLKHIAWEGWGFPGVGDSVVYLVFDPKDALSAPATDRSHGTFSGIPCEVYRVDRLENGWYTVFFYTETDWDHCS